MPVPPGLAEIPGSRRAEGGGRGLVLRGGSHAGFIISGVGSRRLKGNLPEVTQQPVAELRPEAWILASSLPSFQKPLH